MPQILHLRTVLTAAGVATLIAWFLIEYRGRAGPSGSRAASRRLKRIQGSAQRSYPAWLAAIVGGFFLLASAAKVSQLRALSLNAQDFWLFEDIIRQMLQGGFFMTRFAPHAIGWVQHGVIHPYPTFALVLPLAWIAGPTTAALLYGPLFLAGAGAMVATLARPRWGALGALGLAMAFLLSSLVGRILMYDVHPESAYPFFVLLWAWAAGWGDGKLRPPWLMLATVAVMAIKVDSFLVLPPLIAATVARERRKHAGWLAASAAAAFTVSVLLSYAIRQWVSGAWGPHQWQGAPVILPQGPGLLHNRHWDSAGSAQGILKEILAENGGALGLIGALLRFLISRPWLSLLLAAPWVALQGSFWISVLPLATIDSLLDGPGKFLNYYSAPLLGSFWLAIATSRFRSSRHLLWVLCSSLVLGGSGIEFHTLTPLLRQARAEIQQTVGCLERLPNLKPGVVSPKFLAWVPREKVYADRIPSSAANADSVGFYLLSTSLPSYELPLESARIAVERLSRDPHWQRLGLDCRPTSANEGDTQRVLLYFRK